MSKNDKGRPRFFIAYKTKSEPIRNFTAFTNDQDEPLLESTMWQETNGEIFEFFPHKLDIFGEKRWVFTLEGIDPKECIRYSFRARTPQGVK